MPRLGADHSPQRDTPVEGHEPASVGDCKAQEVDIRELAVPLDVGWLEVITFAHRDGVLPEEMICALPDFGEPGDGISQTGALAGILRIRDDPHESILGQRARGPAPTLVMAEPLVRRLVVDVHRVEERDEHVDI